MTRTVKRSCAALAALLHAPTLARSSTAYCGEEELALPGECAAGTAVCLSGSVVKYCVSPAGDFGASVPVSASDSDFLGLDSLSFVADFDQDGWTVGTPMPYAGG